MKIQKRVYLDELHGERRRSSRYRIEAPVELSWLVKGMECRASGWVLELDREWAQIATTVDLPLGTAVHAFVILPPFGELSRLLKIGLDAIVERTDLLPEGQSGNGVGLRITHLVLMGDEVQEELSEDSGDSGISSTGGHRKK
jgi:hypothetical protein